MVTEHSGFKQLGDIEPNGKKYGDANTYIKVDTTNKKIEIWVNGAKVHEWG